MVSKFSKVLLINPAYGKGHYGAVLCPGIGYVAESLRQANIQYDLIDMSVGYSIKDVLNRVEEFKPDLVGISAISIRYQFAYDVAKSIKELNPGIKIVMGGPHASTFRRAILEHCKDIDYVVKLEGEKFILELCKGKDLKNISGLIYRNAGKIRENPDRAFMTDLDNIHFPSYEKFELGKYPEKSIPIVSTRGCPYNCTYCPVKTTIGQQFRTRSAKNVVDELEYWYKKGYRRFGFVDDNFTFIPKRVYEICDEIEKRRMKNLQLTLGNGIRADKVDRKLLKRMKEIGFCEIAFGVESANEDILIKMKKGETLKIIEHIVKDACELGYEVGLFFIIGTPGETEEHTENSFKFAQKYQVAYAYFYNPVPFPQTEMYEYLKANNYLIAEPSEYLNRGASHWVNYPCFWTPELSVEKRKELYEKGKKITREIKRKFLKRKFKKWGPLGAFIAYVVTIEFIHNKIMTSRFIKKMLAKIYFGY